MNWSEHLWAPNILLLSVSDHVLILKSLTFCNYFCSCPRRWINWPCATFHNLRPCSRPFYTCAGLYCRIPTIEKDFPRNQSCCGRFRLGWNDIVLRLLTVVIWGRCVGRQRTGTKPGPNFNSHDARTVYILQGPDSSPVYWRHVVISSTSSSLVWFYWLEQCTPNSQRSC